MLEQHRLGSVDGPYEVLACGHSIRPRVSLLPAAHMRVPASIVYIRVVHVRVRIWPLKVHKYTSEANVNLQTPPWFQPGIPGTWEGV